MSKDEKEGRRERKQSQAKYICLHNSSNLKENVQH